MARGVEALDGDAVRRLRHLWRYVVCTHRLLVFFYKAAENELLLFAIFFGTYESVGLTSCPVVNINVT